MDLKLAKKIVEDFEVKHRYTSLPLECYESVCVYSDYTGNILTDYTYGYLKMYINREEKTTNYEK